MALEDEMLILTKDGKTATFAIVGGELVVTLDGVDAMSFVKDGERLRIEGGTVRVDGGDRIELHADNVLRVDAGGTGITFTGSVWSLYYPDDANGYLKAPPEHPDSGGTPYSAEDTGNLPDYLDEYYSRFPEQAPEE